MLNISVNEKFKKVLSIYGSSEIFKRYEWFLFEFGKTISNIFMRHIGERIETLPGGKEYKRRLILSELRDKGKKSWFAVVASGKSLGDANLDPKETIFYVASKTRLPGDPIYEILEVLGPWTVDTIPFVPSPRQGVVLAKKANPKKVESIKEKNISQGEKTKYKMTQYSMSFDDRLAVFKSLRVVRDLEADAIAYEAGLKGGKQHWKPSLRWLKKQGVDLVFKENHDLEKLWTDPRMRKYRSFKRLAVKLNAKDLKRLQKFQELLRHG